MKTAQLARWRFAWIVGLAAVSLGWLLWAGVAVGQHTCRESVGIGLPANPVCSSLLVELLPLLIAFGFWGIGLVACYTKQQTPTIEFFLLTAGVLATGLLSTIGDQVGSRLFYILLAWFCPVVIHFHYKLSTQSLNRIAKIVLKSCYALAAVGALPLLIWDVASLQQRGWFSILRLGIRLYLVVAIAAAIFLLFWNYRRETSLISRRRIRLITFGTLFVFTPFLILSLLPDTLGAPFHIPYAFTFPWLLLSPLAYGYSLLRHQLTQYEALLGRVVIFYQTIVLLFGGYLAVMSISGSLIDNPTDLWPLGSALVGITILLLLFPVFQQSGQKMVDWIFYGGETDPGAFVGQLTKYLALTLDRQTLQTLLVDELPVKMQLAGSVLLLKDDVNSLSLIGVSGFKSENTIHPLPSDGRLTAYLAETTRPVSVAQIRQSLAMVTLQTDEQALLSLDGVVFWLPLVSSGELHGVLLLGPKLGNDFFTARDKRILATLCHQAGIAAHNIRLIEQVQAGRRELSQAHQQLLVKREQEQRQLARELHDGPVQHLLGISYQAVEGLQLAKAGQNGNLPATAPLTENLMAIRREILDVATQLRRLIGELRPAGLEELGLSAALEGYVAHLKREGGPEMPLIELDLPQHAACLPEPVAICLFRVTQEALRNALKHAGAQRIQLSLHLRDNEAMCTIYDDGYGFYVPPRLSEFARRDRFGLIGMAEQVEWADGSLLINSQPGAGTKITVRIPLPTTALIAENSQ